MTSAVNCPVCNGRGLVSRVGTWAYYNPSTGDITPQEQSHGCYGKGWVQLR